MTFTSMAPFPNPDPKLDQQQDFPSVSSVQAAPDGVVACAAGSTSWRDAAARTLADGTALIRSASSIAAARVRQRTLLSHGAAKCAIAWSACARDSVRRWPCTAPRAAATTSRDGRNAAARRSAWTRRLRARNPAQRLTPFAGWVTLARTAPRDCGQTDSRLRCHGRGY